MVVSSHEAKSVVLTLVLTSYPPLLYAYYPAELWLCTMCRLIIFFFDFLLGVIIKSMSLFRLFRSDFFTDWLLYFLNTGYRSLNF